MLCHALPYRTLSLGTPVAATFAAVTSVTMSTAFRGPCYAKKVYPWYTGRI